LPQTSIAAPPAEAASDSTQPAEPQAETPLVEKPADPAVPYVDDGSKNPERKDLPLKNITFDDVKFEIEKDSKFHASMLTPKIQELVGRKIRVRGYILPTPKQSIRNFVLTRDNLECCFGPGAAIYDCMIVDMVDSAAQYTIRPVTVEGVLTLKEELDFDGITRALYHLDATSVR
jgi:hypothetical protein